MAARLGTFATIVLVALLASAGPLRAPAAPDVDRSATVFVEAGEEGARATALGPDDVAVQGIEADGTTQRTVTRVGKALEEQVIVELRSPALLRRGQIRGIGGLRRGSAAVVTARQQLAAEQSRVDAEILRITARSRLRSVPRAEIIRREYQAVFNGFAASLTAAEQEEVRRLPDVLAIHPDIEVHATLDVSGPLVGAPAFATTFGFDGAGMVIAVIDTGVDYTHPDLGGCLGTGCKVIGGFDFSNDDADPIDDNGHGTHVAATAAGTHPTLRGIAPGASLLAYKVLNRSGSGPSSAVLAGIERAIDPDGDGNTSDRADVINLSLGGPDDVGDPLGQAVENATAAGSLVVAAAGNSGDFFTILSPGSAPAALTVGATDDADQLAGFSSRGPTSNDLAIKPEITAPGVAICAAKAGETGLGGDCIDNLHISISGTSMATPHVAGAAALLRGLFPSLTPEETKSLLVNNSLDLGLPVMEGGAGRLDIPAAAAGQTVLDPAALSYGLDDLNQTVWLSSKNLEVRNRDSVSHSYTLSVDPDPLPAGIQLTLTPQSFVLSAGESITVTAELSVDNQVVPDLELEPHAYEGTVLVRSESQTQRAPFAFIKAPPKLRLTFDISPIAVMIHDRASFSRFIPFPSSTVVEVLIPTGVYDIIVLFPNFDQEIRPLWVVREGVFVGEGATEAFDRSEATVQVSHRIEDAAGQTLSVLHKILALKHRSSGFGVSFFSSRLPTVPNLGLGANVISSAYTLEAALHARSGDDDYFVLGEIYTGIGPGASFDSVASGMTRLESTFFPLPGDPSTAVGAVMWRRSGSLASGFEFARDASGLERSVYLTPVPQKPSPFSVVPFVDAASPSLAQLGGSHPIQPDVLLGRVDVLARPFLDDVLYQNTRGGLPINLGPYFWQLSTENGASSISIQDPHAAIQNPIAFLSQGASVPEGTPGGGGSVPWELYAGTTLIDSGALSQTRQPLDLPRTSAQPAGAYRIVSRGPAYAVGDAIGTTLVELSFDTRRADPDPPYLKLLEIVRNGALTNKLTTGESFTVELEISDLGRNPVTTGVASVALTAAGPGGSVTVAPLQTGPERYVATLTCDPGLSSLAVVAVDGAGNEMRQEFDPAFVCRQAEVCGDGTVDFGEQCDDGNPDSCDGCSPACTFDALCGNGIVESPCEQCDDGDTNPCDGCSATCQTEGFCGDGIHDPACEQCDGGNLEGGDCCTSSCFLESVTTVCRPASGLCDMPEFCTGPAGFCPADRIQLAGVLCRASTGTCSPAEFCDGSSALCPPDVSEPDFTVCDDGLFCNGADLCLDGTCGTHRGDPCRLLGECHGCDETRDQCLSPAGAECTEDGNVCTDDLCDGAGFCSHVPNTSACLAPCVQESLCQDGACIPGTVPVVCTPASQCSLQGTCDPAIGLCSDPPKPDGASCSDGDACTAGDLCSGGTCGGVVLVDRDLDGVCDLVDSCSDLLDADADGVGDSCDNCPSQFNPDQRNSDSSGGGDVCDFCPNDPADSCLTTASAGLTVGPAGGTVTTPDGQVRVDVPAGALSAPTSLSITDHLSPFGGQRSRMLLRTELGPDGQRFSSPTTLTFAWADTDDDGHVDGFEPLLPESDLSVWRNGVQIAGPCSDPSFQPTFCSEFCCDRDANTWTVASKSFGQYVVGPPVGMLIPGTGPPTSDCIIEWDVVDPQELRPATSRGLPRPKRSCTDGDHRCDVDGEADGVCTFLLRACVNADDPRLRTPRGEAACSPTSIARISLRSPRLSDRKPWRAAIAVAIQDILADLGPSTVSGSFRPQIDYSPTLSSMACTPMIEVPIPLNGAKRVSLGLAVKAETPTGGRAGRDADRLLLRCFPE